MSDELVLHAAVTLLASGRAKDPDEAVGVALKVVADCRAALQRARPASGPAAKKVVSQIEAALQTRAAPRRSPSRSGKAKAQPARPARPPKGRVPARPASRAVPAKAAPAKAAQLGIRPRRLLEKMGVVRPHDVEVLPRVVAKRVCRAHLDAARGSGAATIAAIGAWLEAGGERLQDACPTFDENWLTNRCDEAPG